MAEENLQRFAHDGSLMATAGATERPGLTSPDTEHELTRSVHTPRLKVAAVAQRLGVAPATLRTWSRRYGIGPNTHEAGMHRQYSLADVSRLLVMRKLTLRGVSPSEAARMALDSEVDPKAAAEILGPEFLGRPLTTTQVSTTVVTSEVSIAPLAASPPRTPGALSTQVQMTPDGFLPAPHDADLPTGHRCPPQPHHVSAVVDAASCLDSASVRDKLVASIHAAGVPATWELLAQPALAELAERAAESHEPHIEHSDFEIEVARAAHRLLYSSLLTVLGGATMIAAPAMWGSVLVAGAPEESCAVALHGLSAACAEKGVATNILGAAVPQQTLLAAIRASRPRIVVLVAFNPVSRELTTLLNAVDDMARLLLVGPGWDAITIPEGAVTTSLFSAVDKIRLVVRHA